MLDFPGSGGLFRCGEGSGRSGQYSELRALHHAVQRGGHRPFLIGCFISLSMGTSMGTIAAMAPIGVGISSKTGVALPICIGAVVCGAMFGDNLSMISDTTIAAVRTQGCEMKDKFKENFFIVLPAAIITGIIFFVLSEQEQSRALEIWTTSC